MMNPLYPNQPTFDPNYWYQNLYQQPFVPRFHTPNKRVALEPFPTEQLQKTIVNGVLKLPTKAALQGLKVVFGNDSFAEGNVCYVRADRNKTSTWGKEVFEVDGKQFILVPEDEVLVVERYPAPAQAAATSVGEAK